MACTYCSEKDKLILSLRQELNTKNHQLTRLELDLQTLNQKYVAEIEKVGNIQHEKDLVEHELEELSTKLFEEANAMVSIEKRARWQVENELRQTQEHLLAEKEQLHELRLRFEAAEDDAVSVSRNKSRRISRKKSFATAGAGNNGGASILRAQIDLQELHSNNGGLKRVSANHVMKYSSKKQQQQQKTMSMPPPPPPPTKQENTATTIDEIQLESFREYTVAASNKLLTPKKLNQTNFMKHCLMEDIEPCLRFGPQSKLSIKKMIEYLSKQPCFIEHTSSVSTTTTMAPVNNKPTTSALWDRFNSSNKSIILSNSCSACGRTSSSSNNDTNSGVLLNYRFKLDENDNWLPIDQYCRDRLVAVCEFFVFIRNIQLGLYSDRSIHDLYTENIRLKLQMFYSR